MFSIPYNNIYSSKFILDFLNDDSSISSFISTNNKIEDFKDLIATKNFSKEKRKVLVNTISKQYTNTGISNPLNLNKLLDLNTYTVTTGHQLCLFGGPQFFIHKIVSAIALTKRLNKFYAENYFIPVFWMASEDHDFDEISSVSFFNKEINVKGDNNKPVGRIKTEYFLPALEKLKEVFSNDSSGNRLISIFEEAFSKTYWSDCTRYWVDQLFKEYGLIVVDADSKELKSSFSSTLELEIKQQFVFNKVSETNKNLKQLGYSAKVNPREVNLFYLTNLKRERIQFDGDVFNIADKKYSEHQLIEMIKENPENFSPNVLLRPLYQEAILPNVAYLGGPAEIQYWAQLKSAFDCANIEFPKVLLRDSFGWIKKADLDWWKSKGLSEIDLFLDYDKLVKKVILKDGDISIDVKNEIQSIRSKISILIKDNNPSLETMFEGELTKFENAIQKIQSRLIKASKKNDELFYAKIRKIQESLIEKHVLNERKVGFIPFYTRMGEKYIDQLIESANPFTNELKILSR